MKKSPRPLRGKVLGIKVHFIQLKRSQMKKGSIHFSGVLPSFKPNSTPLVLEAHVSRHSDSLNFHNYLAKPYKTSHCLVKILQVHSHYWVFSLLNQQLRQVHRNFKPGKFKCKGVGVSQRAKTFPDSFIFPPRSLGRRMQDHN